MESCQDCDRTVSLGCWPATVTTYTHFLHDHQHLNLIVGGEETNNRAKCCTENNLLHNPRIGLLILEERRQRHRPVYISGAEVEQVNSVRFLGINITETLSWSLYMKRKLTTSFISQGNLCQVLIEFNGEGIQIILTGNVTSWHVCAEKGSSAPPRKPMIPIYRASVILMK